MTVILYGARLEREQCGGEKIGLNIISDSGTVAQDAAYCHVAMQIYFCSRILYAVARIRYHFSAGGSYILLLLLYWSFFQSGEFSTSLSRFRTTLPHNAVCSEITVLYRVFIFFRKIFVRTKPNFRRFQDPKSTL